MTIRKVQVGVLLVAFGFMAIGCDKVATTDTSSGVKSKEVNAGKKGGRPLDVPQGVDPAN